MMPQINDFPSEILQEIFLHFVSHPKEHLLFRSNLCSPTSPYLISKICRRWRDIAFKLARLWTHLHVVDPERVGIVQHLKEWMNRAGNLPLCLSLREYNFYKKQASKAVVTLFLNSLHRCQSFEMVIRTDLEYFRIGKFKRISSTPLESVNVWCKSSSRVDGELLTNLLLDNTCNLRSIRWSASMGPLDTISRSWGDLRELSIIIDTRTLATFFSILSHCQNLEDLKISETFYDEESQSIGVTLPRITLPRLTHLSVLLGHWSKTILAQLLLPSLVELELDLYDQLIQGPVIDLIQRSGVVLRKLSITKDRISPFGHMELAQFLKMPYFEALRILEVGESTAHEFIEFLTLPSSSTGAGDENEGTGGHLVHLENISLVFSETPTVQISQALQKLINSRLGVQPKSVKDCIGRDRTRFHSFSLSIPSK